MKSVLIKMKSLQETSGDQEVTELVTMGTCTCEDGVFQLSYEDTDATGFAGSTTQIRVEQDSLVTILRSGTSNSNLTLELGKKHFCLYQTPFGSMTIGVQARKLSCQQEETHGSIRMEYSIDCNTATLSENTIDLYWELSGESTGQEQADA